MKTLVVFHRCSGKSLGFPPNTILTAKWAEDHGARAIEYNIVQCLDGKKIIVVEPKLLKQAKLDLNNLDWKDVEKLNVGNEKYGYCRVPLLEEMLSVVDNSKVEHQIHIKGNHPATVSNLLSKITGVADCIITTFDIDVIKKIREINNSIPVGWIIKPKQESGGEGSDDLTAAVTVGTAVMENYSAEELDEILNISKRYAVTVIILCGPRIKDKSVVTKVRQAGFQVGAWGVGTNLEIAKKLIDYGVDRFTLDNPEQLHI